MFNIKSLVTVGALLSVASPVFSQTVVRINALGDSITGSPVCLLRLKWKENTDKTRVAGELSFGKDFKPQVLRTLIS